MGRRSYRTINIEKVAGVLTLDQLTRFIINSDNQEHRIDSKFYIFEELNILRCAFMWRASNEGFDYWLDIANSLKQHV